jgi:hypothetical protein
MNHDEIYALLVEMHRGLSAEASAAANARLVLLLANEIGDPQVIERLAAAARAGLAPEGDPPA